MKFIQLSAAEAEELSRVIAEELGYPRKGMPVGAGPHAPIADEWIGPGTPGWIERPAWPVYQKVVVETADGPMEVDDTISPDRLLGIREGKPNADGYTHWERIDRSARISQRIKNALRQAQRFGTPVRVR